jgi:hypothetical protein
MQYSYQPFKLPRDPPKWYHAYVSVHSHPDGWKWVYVCGPTRSPKDAKFVKCQVVKGSRNDAELLAFEDLLFTLDRADVTRVRVYSSKFLSSRFVSEGDDRYYPYEEKKFYGNDELSKRIERELYYGYAGRNVRFAVARDSFVGKRFADELARN